MRRDDHAAIARSDPKRRGRRRPLQPLRRYWPRSTPRWKSDQRHRSDTGDTRTQFAPHSAQHVAAEVNPSTLPSRSGNRLNYVHFGRLIIVYYQSLVESACTACGIFVEVTDCPERTWAEFRVKPGQRGRAVGIAIGPRERYSRPAPGVAALRLCVGGAGDEPGNRSSPGQCRHELRGRSHFL